MDGQMKHLLLTALFLSIIQCFHAEHTQEGSSDTVWYSDVVTTDDGPIRGISKTVYVTSEHPVQVDVFLGIPYAQPPVGDLRFKPPVPITQRSSVWDATTPPASCMQVLHKPIPVYVPDPSTPVNEDCLYLNIWRPHCTSGGQPRGADGQEIPRVLSTMLFLHGGGYMSGSSTVSSYNGAVLAASECVIVVTLNYRLGAFGFLYLGGPEVPGNMGLLDMALALQWVHTNIAHFGGDPESITVFGQSAGGASTSLFLLSPLTHGLFSRAIIQSGSPISHLAQQNNTAALNTGYEFSKAFECYDVDQNNTAIAECLKQVEAASLTEEHFNLVQDYRHFMTAVVDNHFLLDNPLDSLKKRNFKSCPVLLGCTRDEGTFFMGLKWPETYHFQQEQNQSISEQELDKKLAEFFSDFLKAEYISEVIDDVKRIYNPWSLHERLLDPHLTLLNYVIGDVINICPVHQVAKFVASTTDKVWLYHFDIALNQAVHPAWLGAIHGVDIDYVFGRAAIDPKFPADQALTSRLVMSYWANFAKYGNPTPPDSQQHWHPFSISSETQTHQYWSITHISQDMQTDESGAERCNYWAELPLEYFKN